MKNLVDVLTELRDLKIDIFAKQQGIDAGTQMGTMKRKGFTVREICKNLKVIPNTIYGEIASS